MQSVKTRSCHGSSWFRRNYHATRPHVTGLRLASDSPSIRRDNSRIKHGLDEGCPPTDATRGPHLDSWLFCLNTSVCTLFQLLFSKDIMKPIGDFEFGVSCWRGGDCCFNILTSGQDLFPLQPPAPSSENVVDGFHVKALLVSWSASWLYCFCWLLLLN